MGCERQRTEKGEGESGSKGREGWIKEITPSLFNNIQH